MIAETQASRMVCNKMFRVFLERIAPAHNCEHRQGHTAHSSVRAARFGKGCAAKKAVSALQCVITRTHHSEAAVHHKHEGTAEDEPSAVHTQLEAGEVGGGASAIGEGGAQGAGLVSGQAGPCEGG